MSRFLEVSVSNDKYTVTMDGKYGLKALRYGKEWRDLTGDNLIYFLALELQEAREKIESAKNCLTQSGYADRFVVQDNVLKILNDENV